jgi:hypothetical protein
MRSTITWWRRPARVVMIITSEEHERVDQADDEHKKHHRREHRQRNLQKALEPAAPYMMRRLV